MSRRIVVRGSLVAVVLLFASVAASSGAGAAAGRGEAGRNDWNEARTKHFVVVAEGRTTAQKLAARLESFALFFAERGHPIPGNGTVRVVVAPSDEAFKELAGPEVRSASSSVGLAVLSPEHPVMLIDVRERTDDGIATAYRTYVQLALGLDATPLPAWFRDGMAEYYRSFGTHGVSAFVGRAIKEHVYELRDHAFLPWDVFFTADRAALDAMPAERRELFQAQAWLVVHAQFSAGTTGKKQLLSLLEIRDGEQAATVVRGTFGTDFEGFGKRMRDYLERTRMTYQQVEVVVPPAGEVKAAKTPRDDVRAWFASARAGAKEIAAVSRTEPTVNPPYPVERKGAR